MVNVRSRSEADGYTELSGLAAAKERWRASGGTTWISFEDPSEEELRFLEEELGFHPLPVEEIRRRSHEPRFAIFESCHYLILHRIFYSFEAETCEARDFEVFFGERFIVTVNRSNLSRTFRSVAEQVKLDPAGMLGGGPAPLLLYLLELVIQDYEPVIERWQEELDEVEALVLRGSQENVIAKILKFKKLVTNLRRAVHPQRAVLHQLYERAHASALPDAIRPAFRSVIESKTSLLRELESIRTHAGSVFDVYAAVLSLEMTRSAQRQNENMARLSAISMVFLPLTFIVGVYGMNIPDMPELHLGRTFYYTLWAFMLGLVLLMLYLFKRYRWF